MVLPEFPDPLHDPPAAGAGGETVLAGGCFWCVEAVYRQIDGVLDVTSGYAGGSAATADYGSVCAGATDHAEVVRVRFDPTRVTFGRILKVFFFIAHDPTQRNRQGPDVGRQYRSAIFTTAEGQDEVAHAYIRQIDDTGVLAGPIVTEVAALDVFYEAEPDHQDYAARNPDQPYIVAHALAKVEKARRQVPDLVRDGE